MENIVLQITEDDIKNGTRADCSNCPIARAALRFFPGKYVEVGTSTAHVGVVGPISYWNFYNIDKEGADFIKRFDSGETVEPITINLTKYSGTSQVN